MNLPKNYAGMSPAVAEPDTVIRKLSGNDFRLVRFLPVSLTALKASDLQMKKLRMMSIVRDQELFVRGNRGGISGFMALQFTPDRESSVRFLLIKYFAVDRFALTNGAAADMEDMATGFALSSGCIALLVRSAHLNGPATKFYRERGYELNGEALIKKL